MIKKNVGSIDRIIRLFVGLFAIVMSIIVGLNSIVSIIILVVGIVVLLTSIISYCPMYAILKVDTAFIKEKE